MVSYDQSRLLILPLSWLPPSRLGATLTQPRWTGGRRVCACTVHPPPTAHRQLPPHSHYLPRTCSRSTTYFFLHSRFDQSGDSGSNSWENWNSALRNSHSTYYGFLYTCIGDDT
jgi:hypothetical protein